MKKKIIGKSKKHKDEDWSENWSEAATGRSAVTKAQKRQGTNCPLEPLEEAEPFQHVHFGLLAYKTNKDPISAFLSHSS